MRHRERPAWHAAARAAPTTARQLSNISSGQAEYVGAHEDWQAADQTLHALRSSRELRPRPRWHVTFDTEMKAEAAVRS